jgi:hypothetical protein
LSAILTDHRADAHRRLREYSERAKSRLKKTLDPMLTETAQNYRKMEEEIGRWAEDAVVTTGETFRRVAFTDMAIKFTEDDVRAYSRRHGSLYLRYDVKPLIGAETTRMATSEIREIRDVFDRVRNQAQIQGWGAMKAEREMRRAFFEAGQRDMTTWRFIDAGGNKWTGANYWNMLNRTVTANVSRVSYMNTLMEKGRDLARIVNAGDPCPYCRAWDGQIVSMSGTNPRFPSYDAAVNAGVFHPNCVCHLEMISLVVDKEQIDLQTDAPWPQVEKNRIVRRSVAQTGVAA